MIIRPRIAGKPLESFILQHKIEINLNVKVLKNKRIGQSAAEFRTGKGSTTIPWQGVGSNRSEVRST